MREEGDGRGRGRGRPSYNVANKTSTLDRNVGVPSSGNRGARRHSGGVRGGRGGNSPHTNNANKTARLPGGGGSTGNKSAFDRGRIFNSGGQQAVRYEKERRLWKVGPPHGDQHHRFQLTAFLSGLTHFIEHQLEQRAALGNNTNRGDKGNHDAGASRSTTSAAPSTTKAEFVEKEGFSLGEFAALALKDEAEDIEGSENSSSPASQTCTEGNSSTSLDWWPSSLSLVASSPRDAASLPLNTVASKEEQEVQAALAAAADEEQQQQRQQRQRSQPQEGPLELSLRLERLDLTDVEASMLADWTEKHYNSKTAIIKKLWLFGNRLCDDGAAAVARILALGTVTECHLSHNLITLEGAQKLLETVPVGVEKKGRHFEIRDDSKTGVENEKSKIATSIHPLWLRLEWNRISLPGLVNLLEAQHAKRGLLCDVPEAAREDAAPPLPTLPDYLKAVKEQKNNSNGNIALHQSSTEEQKEGEVAATSHFSQGQGFQGQTDSKRYVNSAFTRSTRNQLQYIIEQCDCRLPWVSSQFEIPSEAAVLAEAKNLWRKERIKESDSASVVDINSRPEGSSIQRNMGDLNRERTSYDSANTISEDTILPSSSYLSLSPSVASSSSFSAVSTGPLLLIPDTSALLSMAGADPSVTAPTFFTLEWLFNLSNRGLFGRTLPPREQIFIIVPASVATQLDALKADVGARGAVRRFMSKGLDDMGPAGANFLTMLGAHEGEGLVLEHGAEVAGSRGADVGSRGQATDHRIVEVGLYFQQECVKAAFEGEASTAAATSTEIEDARGEKNGRSGREEGQKAHSISSLPVILLTSDNGQQALAKAHGLPAVRMSDLGAIKAQVLSHIEAGKPLIASVLRAVLRPTAVAALGKVAARSLQMEFDGAISCLRTAIEHLNLAQRREMALKEQILSGLNGQQICLGSVDAESAAEIEATQELTIALENKLKDWDGLIRSHQVGVSQYRSLSPIEMLKGFQRYTAVSRWLLALTLTFYSSTNTIVTARQLQQIIPADVSSPSVEEEGVPSAQLSKDNLNIVVNLQQQAEADAVDADAIPLPLPKNPNPLNFYENNISLNTDNSGSVAGSEDGNTSFPSFAESTAAPTAENYDQASTNNTNEVESAAVGGVGYPFTTRGAYSGNDANPTNFYPWRAAGKLYVRFGQTAFTCSASLIRRGLLVTAAHCVSQFGQGIDSIALSVTFQPGKFDNTVPYGSWAIQRITVPASYLDGSDPCAPYAPGVVCLNDLAVLTVRANSNGEYPGERTGNFGYAWGDYGFSNNFYPNALSAQITQLGYPGNIEKGLKMIRTDALGIARANNQIEMGSAQGPGSSGGPWLVNFGTDVSTSDPAGRDNNGNNVIAVTSWGYSMDTAEVQGASRFGTNSVYTSTPNIVSLVDAACDALDEGRRSKICG